MTNKDDFMRELRATFRVEAAEHLQAIDQGLEQLERGTGAPKPIVESVFRAAHSLKGAARAVDFREVEGICQTLESTFAAWKRAGETPARDELQAAHVALNRINSALGEAAAPKPQERATPDTAAPRDVPAHGEAPPLVTPSGDDTVRVAVRALDQRLLEAEELLAAKLAAAQRCRDLVELESLFDSWRKEWLHVQGDLRELRRGSGSPMADFLDWNQEWMRALENRVTSLHRAAEHDQVHVEKLVDDLLENSKRLLMLPMGSLASLLRKIVRDLARELGKDTDLVIRGEEICVDKRILEEMKDPLVHLLRNSLDHGIESAAERAATGKPARATITLQLEQVNGNQVRLSVGDDGAGIDAARVRAKAVERGLVKTADAAGLDDDAVHALVFETDLSTSPMITQLSGRGLGLAIVREKAEKLGGRVSIDSRRGAGATVHMVLPLTLATFRGVLVESERRTFVVPTSQVERVTRFRAADVSTIEGRETLSHNGRTLALTRLADVLDLPLAPAANDDRPRPALILGSGNERIAFAVDQVLDEREVLVKRLSKPLVRVRNIAGATVLGSGQVAPILNVTELIKSARKSTRRQSRAAATAPAATAAKRVLVAEDSITSRMLLKGILESAGYEVKTAVDGLDAFTLLRSEKFDVLVSDVEMPRLNGFDLTFRLRADRALAELPVVLVTALGSREDRERGVEVGANAYLVKGDLDQGNLVETLRRLL